jgi:hypothetical protein
MTISRWRWASTAHSSSASTLFGRARRVKAPDRLSAAACSRNSWSDDGGVTRQTTLAIIQGWLRAAGGAGARGRAGGAGARGTAGEAGASGKAGEAGARVGTAEADDGRRPA